MKKGQMYEGIISRVDFPNKGIIEIEDKKVIVKDGIHGQKVNFVVSKIRSEKSEGRIAKVLEKSPLECREAACKSFGSCGGCSYQTISYESQLEMKKEQVKRLIDQVTREYTFEGIMGSPIEWGYRNKMEFSFGDEFKNGPLALGLHKKGSFHDIITVDDCRIVDKDYNFILSCVLNYCSELGFDYFHKLTHKGFLRHLLVRKAVKTGEILINIITTSQEYSESTTMIKDADKIEGADRIKVLDQIEGADRIEVLDQIEDADRIEVLDQIEDADQIETADKIEVLDQIGVANKIEVLDQIEAAKKIEAAAKVEVVYKTDENNKAEDVKSSLVTVNPMKVDSFELDQDGPKTDVFQPLVDLLLQLPLSGNIVGIFHTYNDSQADVVKSDHMISLYGRDYIFEELLGLKFKISTFSFFQTNSLGAEVLYSKVREYVGETRDKRIFDLYSGTGTIAQLLAPIAGKVNGVEIVEEAVEAAKENA
ncbi:MAG: hypothetical protein K0S76_2760, partial [Herbinix sp.]|nr:hypothetical protein [Herbinix sp.]